MKNLSFQEIILHWKAGINIVDTRPPMEFSSGFLPRSLYLHPEKEFILRLKSFLDVSLPFVVVTSRESEKHISEMLFHARLKNILGLGVFDAEDLRKNAIDTDIIIEVDPNELGMDLKFDEKAEAIDLRRGEQFDGEHIKGSTSLPLIEMLDVAQVASLDDGGNIYFYGDDEADALTAATIMKKHELHQIRIVTGGWDEIKKEDLLIIEKPSLKSKSGKRN